MSKLTRVFQQTEVQKLKALAQARRQASDEAFRRRLQDRPPVDADRPGSGDD